jgi:glycosyltransferase involved in cell wall biosynthesis
VATSVVIPVRNQPGCLDRTLSSLADQQESVAAFEVVVVDDASTDRTPEVARSYADRIALRLVRNERNLGRAASRNRGAAAATGEHLVFLDADSWAPLDLIARHQRAFARYPGELIMGRRVEMSWWSHGEIDEGRPVPDPLPFEEDQRDARGLSDNEIDYYARTPWLFVATHNMSISAETFRQVGGFDEALVGWGYEDNEFAYRVFQHVDREPGHFRYDADLVCYHLPHFRDWDTEWQGTTAVLPYIKDKFRHYDVELLSHPPNHLRVAQTMPYYERGIAYLGKATNPADVALAAATVPADGTAQLWIGWGLDGARAGRVLTAFDHAEPHGDDNFHLLGTFLPYPDRSFAAVVGVDLWRMLSPMDLSSFVMESLRVADELYLVISRHIDSGSADRIGLVRDTGYLIDMFGSRYAVDLVPAPASLAILQLRLLPS